MAQMQERGQELEQVSSEGMKRREGTGRGLAISPKRCCVDVDPEQIWSKDQEMQVVENDRAKSMRPGGKEELNLEGGRQKVKVFGV